MKILNIAGWFLFCLLLGINCASYRSDRINNQHQQNSSQLSSSAQDTIRVREPAKPPDCPYVIGFENNLQKITLRDVFQQIENNLKKDLLFLIKSSFIDNDSALIKTQYMNMAGVLKIPKGTIFKLSLKVIVSKHEKFVHLRVEYSPAIAGFHDNEWSCEIKERLRDEIYAYLRLLQNKY